MSRAHYSNDDGAAGSAYERKSQQNTEELGRRISEAIPAGCRRWRSADAPQRSRRPQLHSDALYGFLGDYLRLVDPYAEPMSAPIGAHLLCYLTARIGRRGYFIAQGERHYAIFNQILVGPTSMGGKGSSAAWALVLLKHVDPDFFDGSSSNMLGIVGSGQTLVEAIRDPSKEVDQAGDPRHPGNTDKRLIVTNTEWSALLKMMQADGSILGEILRQAFDGHTLRYKSQKLGNIVASEPMVVFVGHVTPPELRETVTTTTLVNGVGNRLNWCWSEIPEERLHEDDEPLPDHVEKDIKGLARKITAALMKLDKLRHAVRFEFDGDAKDWWKLHYVALRKGEGGGLLQALTARGAPIVRRLALFFALLDYSGIAQDGNGEWVGVITEDHLRAADAWWMYSVDTVRFIFGDQAPFDVESLLLHEIREATATGGFLTFTEQSRAFSAHQRSAVVQARDALAQRQLIASFVVPSGGKGRSASASIAIQPDVRRRLARRS